MNKKLLLAALVALLVCGGAWLLIDGGEGRASASGAARGVEPGTNARSAATVVDLAPAATPAEAEVSSPAPAERTDASAREATLSTDHESFPGEEARWVDVTVLLPGGIPPDDEPALLGFTRKDGADFGDDGTAELSKWLGLDDAFAAAVEGEHHWSRRALARSVRMPFPAEAGEAVLFVQSRYLHLDPVELDLASTTAITIEPELGGYVTGRCVPPAGRTVASGEVKVSFDGRAPEEGLMGFARPDRREARVRDDLTFELRALSPSKKYAVSAKAKGLVAHFELSFGIEPGQHREVEFPFRAGATIAGFVRGDGQPVAHARVRAEIRAGIRWNEDVSAQSGDDGAFLLEGVPPGKLTLEASKDGWREAKSERLEVADGQRLSGIELVLDAGLRVAGTVQWPDGTPVEGAEVQAWDMRQGWLRSVVENTTGEGGAFVLRGLEEGAVEVFASHAPRGSTSTSRGNRPGRAEHGDWVASLTSVAPGSAGLVLTLQEPHLVSGTVVDDTGTPAAQFRVSAQRSGRPDNAPESVEEGFEAKDGSFTLPLGLPGEWTLRASQGEREGEPITLLVPQGGTALRLVLPRGSSVSGVVVDPSGNPVSDASIHFSETVQEAAFARFAGDSASSGRDGRFELEGSKSGFLHATHEDWAASEQIALELNPGETLVDVVVRMRVGARITGEVFDEAGKPQAGQNVSCASGAMAAMSMGFGAERSTRSDGNGRFVFERVSPGKVTVSALPSEEELVAKLQQGEGNEQAFLTLLSDMRSASVEVTDGGEAHVVLGSKPKQPVRVHGRVTAAGDPLVERQVFAFAEGGALLSGMKFARTDGAGRYELVLDRPGDFVFGVGLNEGMQGTGTQFYVAVPEAAEFELDLALPLGRISGNVLGPDGPAAGVPLRLVYSEGTMGLEDMSEGNRANADDGGAFAFEHLRPGTYSLQVGSDLGGSSDERYGQLVVDGLVVEKDRALDGLVVRLREPGRLSGVVRDVAGNPASGVTIFVRDSAGRAISTSSCASDAAGRFTYQSIAPGRITASARNARLVSAESETVEIQSGETSTLELTVSEGTFLRVSLLPGGDDDTPVRARLRVLDDSGRRVDDLMSLEDVMGVLSEGFSSRERRVGPLAPGKYTLIAVALDGRDAKKSLTVEAGQSERVVKLRLK